MEALIQSLGTLGRALPVVVAYLGLIALTWGIWRLLARRRVAAARASFGDAGAVRSNAVASVLSVLFILLLWGAFTGSALLPRWLHAPGPFTGEAILTYAAEGADWAGDPVAEGTLRILVHPPNAPAEAPATTPKPGPVQDDAVAIPTWRSALVPVLDNDAGLGEGARITAIEGTPVTPGGPPVETSFGTANLTPRGSLNVVPRAGWQMEPIWLPPPEAVVARVVEIARDGYRNVSLLGHVGASVGRVAAGFLLGALVGVPLGYAMGLSSWVRGWFDPLVEFMRPVPPLALIPLVIIWAGIGEAGKVVLLFLAALWIMAIAARSGVAGVRLSKVHAAYTLGASRAQVLRHVIVPNSLPEIFTGARVAMGVCWGTVVAAELVAAERGAGMMIMTASRFQQTDIVIMGIILIGIIGFGIDVLMRWAERRLVPWKGRA